MASYLVLDRELSSAGILLFGVRKVFLAEVTKGMEESWYSLYPYLSTMCLDVSCRSHSFHVCECDDKGLYSRFLMVRIETDKMRSVILAEADTLEELNAVCKVFC